LSLWKKTGDRRPPVEKRVATESTRTVPKKSEGPRTDTKQREQEIEEGETTRRTFKRLHNQAPVQEQGKRKTQKFERTRWRVTQKKKDRK